MATVSFLWHLHQPAYRTADGVAHAPWVLLHAGGAYATLAHAIEHGGGCGQVLNIVPTLLEQLVAYRDREVHDPVVEAMTTPASDLSAEQVRIVVEWSRPLVPEPQLSHKPERQWLRRAPGDAFAGADEA